MLMLLVTIVLMAVSLGVVSVFYARYCFTFLAHRFYTTGELSGEFRTQFDAQLAQAALPCKRLIESKVLSHCQSQDNRPIVYAAGELYINEDICKDFSPEEFAAGLLYEQAHHDTGFYAYSWLIMCILFIGCLPMVALINNILQSLVAHANAWQLLSLLAYVVNLLHRYPLLQFILIGGGTIALEFALGASVVNFYAARGYDLPSLLRYLRNVESYVTPGLNGTFNISSNRKRCEKLLEDE